MTRAKAVRMRRVAMAGILAALGGCESDAAKIDRLRTEEASACLPVMVADSIASTRAGAIARLTARNAGGAGSSSIAEMRADLDEVQRHSDKLSADIKKSPAALEAEEAAVRAQRTKCDLARRSVTMFMAGR